MKKRTVSLVAALALIAAVPVFTGIAAADTNTETATPTPTPANNSSNNSNRSDGSPIIKINLDEVVEAVNGLKNGLDSILIDVLLHPFKQIAEAVLDAAITLLTVTPQVHPNPAVEEVHYQALIVAILVSSLGFAATGILYMIGPVLGVSYREARMALPRIIAALVFAAVSLPLLQYAVEFTNALTTAFKPDFYQSTMTQMFGIQTGIFLAIVLKAVLLLAVVVLFILRDVYILAGAAASPILALAWSFPKTRNYANKFISSWWAALFMAPADMFVLKFSYTLMQGLGSGTNILQSISNWVFGVASLALLLLVPYQLWSVSGAAAGFAWSMASGAKKRVRQGQKLRQKRNEVGDRLEALSKDEVSVIKHLREKGITSEEDVERDRVRTRGRDTTQSSSDKIEDLRERVENNGSDDGSEEDGSEDIDDDVILKDGEPVNIDDEETDEDDDDSEFGEFSEDIVIHDGEPYHRDELDDKTERRIDAERDDSQRDLEDDFGEGDNR